MSLDVPTPPNKGDDGTDESLESLRAELKAQRAAQKESLAKHKRTTFLAVEVAKKGTTFLDAEKFRRILEDDSEDETEDEDEDDSTAE